eukprot:874814-Pleurochrysis_carterae.AAC.1
MHARAVDLRMQDTHRLASSERGQRGGSRLQHANKRAHAQWGPLPLASSNLSIRAPEVHTDPTTGKVTCTTANKSKAE